MKRIIFPSMLMIVSAISCSPNTPSVSSAPTESPPADTPAPTFTAAVSLTPTVPPIVKSALSGLPYPEAEGVSRPDGLPGTLIVLDWAGFEAALSYTFDDGQPSQVDHYDELAAQGVPMTFYICEGWSGTSADFVAVWSRAAAEGNEIGNHTANHSHSTLADTGTGKGPLASQDLEISQNADYITNTISHQPVWSFAAPYGDRGWAWYAAQYYFVNRGVSYGMIAPGDNTDPLNLPVFMAVGGESEKALNLEIDTARSGGNWLIFLFHTLLPTSQEWYAGVEVENVAASMYHARAAQDVWIDVLYKVAAYWMGQKILMQTEPAYTGGDYVWSWTLPPHFPTGMYLRVTVSGGTVSQDGSILPWDPHGFYEIALDAGSLTVSD
ncbi:MAG: polysaccharide deacetylase family protein [Anaerolineales bacterium]|nr:polysaccharide deacetylase family protein [Anaerolineales bacterium]